ncbi:MAG: hypothetical protein HN341_09155 [Verrucomicrobia bacterium]|jgi:hypothetical protein|nr:hypothetical protein [Verrucomicrobiota bacterium]MBT7066378.1 hypothetical protein [Verrucomicrobiota bacterium]
MINRIPETFFEAAGTVCGLTSSAIIATQVYAEYTSDSPSTLSPIYSTGFLVIFIFWTLYGVRFRRVALWLTNGIAVVMQTLLLITISIE